MSLRKLLILLGTVSFSVLISGCAGSLVWAKHASPSEIQEASDFDLCHQFLLTNSLNPAIATEILRRGLLTKDESDALLQAGKGGKIAVGTKKCAAFAAPTYWKEESQEITTDGHSKEIWRSLDCEPTLFTLLGHTCGYVEFTFEDNVVTDEECYEWRLANWCESGALVNRAKTD